MSTQEKKKRNYKIAQPVPVAVPVPLPIPEPASDPPKKKRVAKVAPVVEVAVPVVVPVVDTPVTNVIVEEPKKKRSYKVRSEGIAPAALEVPAAKPPKKERKKRVVKSVPSVPIEQPPIRPKAIESFEAPLCMNDEDVLVINVRKFEHNGKWYFLNSAKDKLYTIGTDGQPFQYHGRYNRESETIDTDFPDSDAEY